MSRLAGLLLLVIAGLARATALDQARDALQALRFEDAVQTAAAGLARGGASAEETAQLEFVLGQASAVLGRDADARLHFGRALELLPALELPPGSSPKLVAPFQAARAGLEGPLRITVQGTALDASRAQIQVSVQGDVFHFVARGVVTHPGGDTPLARTEPPQATISCAAWPCPYSVTLSDLPGNTLLRAGSTEAPLLVLSQQLAATPEVTAGEPWYRQPTPWLIAAGVLAAASGVLAWQTVEADHRLQGSLAQPSQLTYAEAQAMGRARDALYGGTWAAGGLAVASAAVGVIVW